MTKTIEVKDKFFMPMQHVETATEMIVEKILSRSSGVLVIPEAANWFIWPLRMMPMWWQVFMRNTAGRGIKAARSKEIKTAAETSKS